ncbi:MAG TPA: ATP-binding protein [Candidatus Saccharimonadales bacterium]|nr:ATP-binding protein [Candidatus Saccharimonadales bacterium]
MTIVRRGIRCICLVVLTLLSVGALTQAVFADAYGVGGYGSCTYQNCAPPVTTTTMPSGLEVSVNLTDGQVIPRSGYTVVITPLNGSTTGQSFTSVDIYIDGNLVQTVTPEETGTAYWPWDPVSVPGTDVKLVITGSDGSTVTKEFQVTIGAAPPVHGGSSGGATTPSPKQSIPAVIVHAISNGVRATYNGTKRAIAALPKPVAYAFPYFLYVLLGVNLLVLMLQLKRELSEYKRMQIVVARERQIADSVKTLLQLVAHYLRTPLTILKGGVELLEVENAALAATLKAGIDRLKVKIDALLEQIHQDVAPVVSDVSADGNAVWRQPGLWVPLVVSAAIVVPFNYIARHAGTLKITQVNLIAQFIIYSLLATVTYQVFRRLQLHRRDILELQRVSSEEQTVDESRVAFITTAAKGLEGEVTSLDQLAAALPKSKAGEFILNGEKGFHDLTTKLRVGAQLRAAPGNNASLQQVSLSAAVSQVLKTLQPVIVKRAINTQLQGGDTALQVSSPELLEFVLRSLLDNAIAYSADGGLVEIAGATGPTSSRITITDHGSGIAAEKLPLLFEPFSKLEGAEVFTHEGMGFSLYLDRLIMNYLGGSINIVSEPGKGTVVTVELPLAPPTTAAPAA